MAGQSHYAISMLTELYVEALLADEELADQVWEAWDKGEIDDQVAWLAWSSVAVHQAAAEYTLRSAP